MATVPTPEETAQKILAIFLISFKFCPGSVLTSHNIIGVWNNSGLHHADLKPGLDYAEEQGWIEIFDGGNSIRLTAVGFAQAKDRH